MKRFLGIVICAFLVFPVSAKDRGGDKMPDDVLQTMISVAAAVDQTCDELSISPGFKRFVSQYGSQINKLMESAEGLSKMRSDTATVSAKIADVGCGAFADAMNKRGLDGGFQWPMFVRK